MIASALDIDRPITEVFMADQPATYTEEQRANDLEECAEANDALFAGAYETAKILLEVLSNAGNLTAKVDLALLHIREFVISSDFDYAMTLLHEASTSGMPMASVQLGSAYEKGAATAQNLSQALKFYLIAADLSPIN